MQPQIPEALAASIRESVFAGRKIEAIKAVREATGLGLKEAKDLVEQLEEELRRTTPEKFTAPRSGKGCAVRILCCLLFVIGCVIWARAAHAAAKDHLRKNDDWFRSAEGQKAADNVLSWQSNRGDWPKAIDTAGATYDGDRSKLKGTFDNRATVDEIRFLGRAYVATKDERFREAAEKGIDHVLAAQYANGGWPQTYPPGSNYPRYITFNDQTFEGLMRLMREVATEERWTFVGDERRQRAKQAFDRGIECILNCQIRDPKTGKLSAWCAQHDEKTLEPRPARTFELVSLSGCETVGLVRLLMSIERPTPRIIESVEAAVAWLQSARIPAIKQVEVDDPNSPKGKDKRIVPDPAGPGLWARFYQIDTGRPIFVDRDGVAKFNLADIGYERRNGYAWYGDWPESLLSREYPAWKKRIENRG